MKQKPPLANYASFGTKSLKKIETRKGNRWKSPVDVVLHSHWNAFEDFSAFRSYYAALVLIVFAVGLWGLFAVGINEAICYGILSAFTLLPLYFWVREKSHGLPIYPIYALTFYPTFALQFLINENIGDLRGVFQIETADLYATSLAVSVYIMSGFLPWISISGNKKPILKKIAVMDEARMNLYTLAAFIASALLTVAVASEQFAFIGRLMSILVAVNRTVAMVTLFLLSYQWGRGRLSKGQLNLFFLAFGLAITATAGSLFLIGVISMAAVSTSGFILGRRRVPWIILVLSFVFLYILHAGKGDMREKYWHLERGVATVRFIEYPAFFYEWFSLGVEQVRSGKTEMADEKLKRQQEQDLLERSSLIGIFLTVYKTTPITAPFLRGETYRAIPLLLIPRFLYPDKPIAHIGQQKLNVHFGIQSEADVQGTFIAWGLFNEGYANFGWWGLVGIGVILGIFYGAVSRFSAQAPLLSYRGLLGVMTLGFAFQGEMAAGVWVTAYVQSFLIVTAARIVLMKPEFPNAPAPKPLPAGKKLAKRYYTRR
jgi:hypothetical protein